MLNYELFSEKQKKNREWREAGRIKLLKSRGKCLEIWWEK